MSHIQGEREEKKNCGVIVKSTVGTRGERHRQLSHTRKGMATDERTRYNAHNEIIVKGMNEMGREGDTVDGGWDEYCYTTLSVLFV